MTPQEQLREACAKVLDDKHCEFAKRSYPPPLILREMAAAIRAIDLTQFERGDDKNQWKETLIDGLVVCHIYTKEHDSNPRKALHDIVNWNVTVALDPLVSEEAQELIDKGKTQALADKQEEK